MSACVSACVCACVRMCSGVYAHVNVLQMYEHINDSRSTPIITEFASRAAVRVSVTSAPESLYCDEVARCIVLTGIARTFVVWKKALC